MTPNDTQNTIYPTLHHYPINADLIPNQRIIIAPINAHLIPNQR